MGCRFGRELELATRLPERELPDDEFESPRRTVRACLDTRTFVVSRKRIHRSLRVRRVGFELQHRLSQHELEHRYELADAVDQSAIEPWQRREGSALDAGLDREQRTRLLSVGRLERYATDERNILDSAAHLDDELYAHLYGSRGLCLTVDHRLRDDPARADGHASRKSEHGYEGWQRDVDLVIQQCELLCRIGGLVGERRDQRLEVDGCAQRLDELYAHLHGIGRLRRAVGHRLRDAAGRADGQPGRKSEHGFEGR